MVPVGYFEIMVHLSFLRRLSPSRNVLSRILVDNFKNKCRPGTSVKPTIKSKMLYEGTRVRLHYEFTLNESLC